MIWAAARSEKAVAQRLQARGIEVWLPLHSHRRQWSDRSKIVLSPLFPGYLFARIRPADWSTIIRIPGVLTLVRNGSSLAQLEEGYVAALRRAVADPCFAAEPVDSPPVFESGDEVVVTDGPLAGLTGVVRDILGSRRLLVWLPLMQRGVSCLLGSSQLRAAQVLATLGSSPPSPDPSHCLRQASS